MRCCQAIYLFQVLGSGSSRIITISAAAQSRRWTSELVKVLKGQPGRAVQLHELPQLYHAATGRPFSPVDYGVCTVAELMQRVNPQAVTVAPDGTISLPRRLPTPEERARTREFAMQVSTTLSHHTYIIIFIIILIIIVKVIAKYLPWLVDY